MLVKDPKTMNKFLKSINSLYRVCMVCHKRIGVKQYRNNRKLCPDCYQEWVVKL